MRRASLLLVLCTGCSVSLDVGQVPIVCDEDADCPQGRCELTIQRCFDSGTGTPLRLTSAVAVSTVRVDAVFNQELAPGSIVDISQVTIEPALEVTGFTLDETQQRLSITTAEQAFDTVYTLTIQGVVSSGGDGLDVAARSQSFVSFQGLADRSPPAIIRPADGSRVVGGNVAFAWQAISKATSYTVEVQRRDSAAPPIVVEVPATSTTTEIAVPLEGAYDWRVRADVTSAGVYSNAVFDAVVDAIYVYCPGGECAPRVGNGSRRAPVQRINEGLVLARQLQIGTVRVAARGDGGTYDEILVLADVPVTIDGGFDATFTPGTGRAEVAAVGTVLVVRPASAPVRIAHLLLSALAAPNLEVVSVEGGVDLTLDDVVILAEETIDTNIGINCDGRPDIASVHLRDVTMLLTGTAFPQTSTSDMLVGIRARETRLDVTDTLLSVGIVPNGGGPLETRGIELLESGTFAATRLEVGVGYATAVSTAFFDNRNSRPAGAPPYDVIDASRFWVPHSNQNILGFYLAQIRDLVVRNSVISVGPANAVEGVRMAGGLMPGVGPRFIHDLLQLSSDRPSSGFTASTKGYIVANSVITSTPCTHLACGTWENNCIFANGDVGPAMLAGTALACEVPYAGIGLGAPDFSQPSPTCTDGMGRVIRCSGTTEVAPPIELFFANLEGPDGDILEARDNDYHLVAGAPAALRNGGSNLSGDVCGYADQSLPCQAGTSDADGATRGAPFSMGPYEY